MPRSQRAIPRKRGDEKMGKKNEMQNSASRCSRDKDGTGWAASRDQAGFERSKLVQGDVFLETVGHRPWNMGAGAMTMSGQWQPRSGQLSAWSQRDVLVAGPPTQKKAPAVIFLSRLPPPRHYIPLIAHHLLTLSLADHLLCYIPSLTIESPLSRFPKTLAHHGQLSRAAQGHWHCKSFYPAKPLKCVELDGELQGATVVAILAGQTASRLAHMVVMALGHDANRALEIQVVVSDSGMLSLAPSPMFSETCC